MSYGRIPEENQLMYVYYLPSEKILMNSQADDDDLDTLSFTQPQAGSSAPPAGSSIQPPSAGSGISGRIGQSNAPKTTSFGGVRMETRYTGEPTLDEPVSKTIVRYSDAESS